MDRKEEKIALCALLGNLNMGKKTIPESELEAALSEEVEQSLFGKKACRDILKQLEKDKLINRRGDGTYDIIVDIASLRERILGLDKAETAPAEETARMGLGELLDAEWVAVENAADAGKSDSDEEDDEDDDDDDEDDEETIIRKLHEELNDRRRMILKRMWEDNADAFAELEKDEEGGESEENEEMGAENGEEEDGIRAALREILNEEPDMDRARLFARLQERYREVKDGENFDDIVRFAQCLGRVAKMSDEEYASLTSSFSEEEAEETEEDGLPKEVSQAVGAVTEALMQLQIGATRVAEVSVGAAVMRFEVEFDRDIAVSSCEKWEAELGVLLHEDYGVRMYADRQNGGIYVEVPRVRRARETVRASDLFREGSGQQEKEKTLLFAIGRDFGGKPVYGDIRQLKHILVGGTGGSGKSSFLHTMIYSIISTYSPDDVRFILCDSGRSEFDRYLGLPHLLTGRIVTKADEMSRALLWMNKELERRFQLLMNRQAEGAHVMNVEEYNASCRSDGEKLPYIVMVVDEYADFIKAAKHELEQVVQRLGQKARAVGLHLVFATRSSSPEVISGAIKADFPTRVSFRMYEKYGSLALLDERGAEQLLGEGDMLMRAEGDFQLKRFQCARVSQEELNETVGMAKEMYEAKFDREAVSFIFPEKTPAADQETELAEPPDPKYLLALATVIKSGKVSISLVQRKCCIGYNHAGKIIEWMENMGYIAPAADGGVGYTVLLTWEEFVKKYGPFD